MTVGTSYVHNRRSQILEFVGTHPGSYLGEIQRVFSLATGVAQYHLHHLERDRQIVSARFGRFRRYYAASGYPETDRALLDVLLRETERDILLHLLRSPGTNQVELSRWLQIAPPSVSWHMARLRNSGLIRMTRSGRSVAYELKVEPAELVRLLRDHPPTLLRRWVDRLENLLDTCSAPNLPGERNER